MDQLFGFGGGGSRLAKTCACLNATREVTRSDIALAQINTPFVGAALCRERGAQRTQDLWLVQDCWGCLRPFATVLPLPFAIDDPVVARGWFGHGQ